MMVVFFQLGKGAFRLPGVAPFSAPYFRVYAAWSQPEAIENWHRGPLPWS